jgi:hypothetical protein
MLCDVCELSGALVFKPEKDDLFIMAAIKER